MVCTEPFTGRFDLKGMKHDDPGITPRRNVASSSRGQHNYEDILLGTVGISKAERFVSSPGIVLGRAVKRSKVVVSPVCVTTSSRDEGTF
ncbi:hypothetical protein MRX96_031624 [Rhipicephalus microplus]